MAYARSLPYLEPSSIEQVSERYQKMIMPDRIPEPPQMLADKGGDQDTKVAEKKAAKKKGGDKKSGKNGAKNAGNSSE